MTEDRYKELVLRLLNSILYCIEYTEVEEATASAIKRLGRDARCKLIEEVAREVQYIQEEARQIMHKERCERQCTRSEERRNGCKDKYEMWWAVIERDVPTEILNAVSKPRLEHLLADAYCAGYEEGYELGHMHGGDAEAEEQSDGW